MKLCSCGTAFVVSALSKRRPVRLFGGVPRPGSPRRLPGRCRRCRGPFAETAAAAAEAEVSGRRSGAHTSRYRFLTASKAPAWCAKSGVKQADGLREGAPQVPRAGSPFSSHLVRSITSGLSPEGLSAMMLVFCGPGGSAEQGEAREAGGRRRWFRWQARGQRGQRGHVKVCSPAVARSVCAGTGATGRA